MKKALMILCVFTLLITFGCTNQNSNAEPGSSAIPSESTIKVDKPLESAPPIETPTPVVTATPGVDQPIDYKSKEKIVIDYYDVVSEKTVTKEYEIGTGESNRTAFDAVNEIYLKDLLESKNGIQVNSVTHTDGNVFIDFTDSIYQTNFGSTGEVALLDSIADAYLNNVEGIKGVYYTVNGKPYSSGHIEIPANQPYKQAN